MTLRFLPAILPPRLTCAVNDLSCQAVACQPWKCGFPIEDFDTASIALRGGFAKLVRLPLLPLDRRPESIRPCIPEVNFNDCNHSRYRAQELAVQVIGFRP
jgi:hypothetical protein